MGLPSIVIMSNEIINIIGEKIVNNIIEIKISKNLMVGFIIINNIDIKFYFFVSSIVAKISVSPK